MCWVLGVERVDYEKRGGRTKVDSLANTHTQSERERGELRFRRGGQRGGKNAVGPRGDFASIPGRHPFSSCHPCTEHPNSDHRPINIATTLHSTTPSRQRGSAAGNSITISSLYGVPPTHSVLPFTSAVTHTESLILPLALLNVALPSPPPPCPVSARARRRDCHTEPVPGFKRGEIGVVPPPPLLARHAPSSSPQLPNLLFAPFSFRLESNQPSKAIWHIFTAPHAVGDDGAGH